MVPAAVAVLLQLGAAPPSFCSEVARVWLCASEAAIAWDQEVAKLKPGPETEYRMKYDQAVKEKRKLVVFIGEPARGEMDEFDGHLLAFMHDTPAQRQLWGLSGPGVVVCVPKGDSLFIESRRERKPVKATVAPAECVGGA